MSKCARSIRISLRTLSRYVTATERFIIAAGVVAMALVTIANVFARVVLNNSLTFAEEVNRHLVVLVTFVGLSYAVGQARHIRMSALFDLLQPRYKKLLICLICFLNAFFMFALCYYALRYIEQIRVAATVTSSLRLPLWATYLPVPVGLFMAGTQYAFALFRNLTDRRVFLSYEVEHGFEELEVGEI